MDEPDETEDILEPAEGLDFAAGQMIVRFADGVSDSDRTDWLVGQGATVIDDLPIINGALVDLGGSETGVLEMAALWSADAIVAYAEPNYLRHFAETFPNDPSFSSLWGLHNVGQTGGTPDADIDAPEAWDITTGSSTVVIASIDSGVDYNHEDLAANMWVNPGEIAGDGIDNDANGYIDDIYGIDAGSGDSDPWDSVVGHGTHTSGDYGRGWRQWYRRNRG